MRQFPQTSQLVSVQLVLELKQWGTPRIQRCQDSPHCRPGFGGCQGGTWAQRVAGALLGQEKGCS